MNGDEKSVIGLPDIPPQMILLVGIPGSGKSTFAAANFPTEYVRISRDVLRTRARVASALAEAMERRRNIVIDNTNVERIERERFILPARAAGYRVTGYYFQSVIKDCLGRNAQRSGAARIPDAGVIARAKDLEMPSLEEGFDELFYVSITDAGFAMKAWSPDYEKK